MQAMQQLLSLPLHLRHNSQDGHGPDAIETLATIYHYTFQVAVHLLCPQTELFSHNRLTWDLEVQLYFSGKHPYPHSQCCSQRLSGFSFQYLEPFLTNSRGSNCTTIVWTTWTPYAPHLLDVSALDRKFGHLGPRIQTIVLREGN